MAKIIARSLDRIAEQFGRLSADHTRDLDTLRDARILLRQYREHATQAGGLIIELRGEYGDGRDKDDDPPDARHVPGISAKVLGRNVRRGFVWEGEYERGSDEHKQALWGRGVISEWLPIRTPSQFGSSAKAQWATVTRTAKLRGAELLAATMTILTNSRNACDAMCTELEDGIREAEPGFTAKPVVTYSANDARDEWLYQQRRERVAIKTIIAALSRNEHGWEILETPGGIDGAIRRYCKRTGKPLPAHGKRGRPKIPRGKARQGA